MDSLNPQSRRYSKLDVFIFLLVTIILTVAITSWFFLSEVLSTEFKPVQLNAEEEQTLNTKIKQVITYGDNNAAVTETGEAIKAEKYTEQGANRTIEFSEREVNALMAKNTNAAQRVAIDLSDNLMSIKLLVPLDKDLPLLGGQTLKVTSGLEINFVNNKPRIVLKGISIWGVPVPSAYLGDMKNRDLIEEYGQEGFWKHFSDGIKNIEVRDSNILVELRE